MRRSQTVNVRHSARPSIFTAEDLGLLKESDESTEDMLRRQLLEQERENDKLRDQLLQLQAQLAQRPPLEKVQELKKEYTNLEIILQGTQRENERCMTELERTKQHEKALEKELERLVGANWQENLDITPASALTRIAFGSPTHARAGSMSASPAPDGQPDPAADKEASKAYIEQVRLLIIGMEQRLQDREERLLKNIDHAETEGKKFEEARKRIVAAGTK